jgi:hypothetical protein
LSWPDNGSGILPFVFGSGNTFDISFEIEIEIEIGIGIEIER